MAYRGMIEDISEGPSGMDMFAEAFGNLGRQGGEEIVNYFQQQKEDANRKQTNKLLGELTGLDPQMFEGISPDERRDLLKSGAAQRSQETIERLKGEFKGPSKEEEKKGEKVRQLDGAMERLNQMREIRAKGNLGVWVKAGTHLLGGETARDKGKYEQLGKSLISLATTIPIRNRLEFETLADRLYEASISDAEAEGVLDGMEEIIESSIYEAQGGTAPGEEVDMVEEVQEGPKELTEEAFTEAMKKSSGNPAKAKRMLKKMGYKV